MHEQKKVPTAQELACFYIGILAGMVCGQLLSLCAAIYFGLPLLVAFFLSALWQSILAWAGAYLLMYALKLLER